MATFADFRENAMQERLQSCVDGSVRHLSMFFLKYRRNAVDVAGCFYAIRLLIITFKGLGNFDEVGY